MPKKAATPPPPPPPVSTGSVSIGIETSADGVSMRAVLSSTGSAAPPSAGSLSVPPPSAPMSASVPPPSPAGSASAPPPSAAGSASAPPPSAAASASVPPPNSAASSLVPSASFHMLPFDEIKPGMVVQTNGCRYPEDLIRVLGLPEDDHISDKAPLSAKHWVLVVDTITDHKRGRKKVLLCVNITTLQGVPSLEESTIPAAWREFFIPIATEGEPSEDALIPVDGWPGERCWVMAVSSMQLINRNDEFRVVDGAVKFDENSVRRVRDVVFHNEKSGLMAALLDPGNEIHHMKDEAPAAPTDAEEAPAEESPLEEGSDFPDPRKKAKITFDDVMPGMVARAQHARFSEELCEQLGIPLDDPICRAKTDDSDHEELMHEVLVLHKGRDAPTGKQVLIGLNITRLGGVQSLDESSVPAHWKKYFIKIDPEGNAEDGDLVPMGGWRNGPAWAITVKTAEIITGEGKEYKVTQGAIVKFDETAVRGLFDTAIYNEKDRIAAAIVDNESWLHSHLPNTLETEPEPETEQEQEPEVAPPESDAETVPPPTTAGASEAASESSQPAEPPRSRRTLRSRRVSIVESSSEVIDHTY